MKKAPAIFLSALAFLPWTHASAEDIILRLQPDPNAPAITRIIATEKVLLEAAPAGEKSDWKKLVLTIPFDGYVPAATLTKSFAIIQGTPVHFLPNASSETITRVQDGDVYEVKRVKDEWATIGLKKELTTYFLAAAVPTAVSTPSPTLIPAAPLVIPEPPVLELAPADPILELAPAEPAPTPAPESLTNAFDPSLSVGSTAPEHLPPENVVWESAASMPRAAPPVSQPEPLIPNPAPRISDIMVSSDDTQAREAQTKTPPTADKPHRVLTGTLVRKIETSGPAYPIRLQSPDGRFIAYVDFSAIFVDDLSLYLDQRVVLRGQINPVRQGGRDLVISVHQILPAN